MKRVPAILILLLFVLSAPAYAVPLDLSGFTGEPPELSYADSDTVYLEEDWSGEYGYVYFSNDSYAVAGDALNLSFDWLFALQPDDVDWLVVQINGVYVTEIQGDNYGANEALILSGTEIIDLSPYQGSIISLAFGLEYDWEMDWSYTSFASLSNLDVEVPGNTAPVPEPSTIVLMGLGIVGMAGIGRKKLLKH